MVWPAPCDIGVTHQLRVIGADFERYDIVTNCPTPLTLTEGDRAGSGSTVRAIGAHTIESKKVGVDIPGEIVTSVRDEPRTLTVPVVIHGSTETELETALTALPKFLNARTGPCRLVWTRTDGESREITAHYRSGAETLRISNLSTHRHVEGQLVFRAYDPHWKTWGGTHDSNGIGTFNNALGAGITHVQLTNIGDVEAWPEFVFGGPVERVEIANQSTGGLFQIREVIAAGQEIRIYTDPRERGVYVDDVWKPSAVAPSIAGMWPLTPGVNNVILRAVSPGDAGTWFVRWPRLWGTPG